MTLVPVDSVAPIRNQSFTPPTPLVKGVIVMLARNTDADGAAKSITELEKRFNGRWRYPYVFLNELPFDDNFKNKLQAVNPSADMKFGLIPVVHWSYPSWINQTRAAAARKAMHEAKIIYGGHEAYRHMCRYNSGFFYRHELLDEYDYYWRVEPDVHFYCDIDEDPFRFMQENNKLYGFTVSLTEFRATIPTLWETTRAFMTENPSYIRTEDNAVRWISKDLKDYNLCHFWSNFEIGSLHLWRSKAYEGYFEHLDHAGGFFYERWGDAPVHSIGATLLLKPSQIHFFNNIGYDHTGINHCPIDQPAFANKCQCNGLKNFDMTDWSCTPEWFDLFGDTSFVFLNNICCPS
ncbi:Mnt1 protein [Fimicolochytrium jonesii]|uniref:Mnt1 protein n=1 Tax=Fimicolochytrium jonesii TaxID=1396493 RepID=UPI0022FECD49|nr:Mnt1 protein [Fimicolochytrium jonesii]KAI8818618.1 Mnt1 protein [Fimicolochytrium jonesii]